MAIDWKKTKVHRQKNVEKVQKARCLPGEQEMERLDKVKSLFPYFIDEK